MTNAYNTHVPVMWNNYSMPHAGYFTGARITFGGAAGNIRIKNGSGRPSTTTGSSLKLMARLKYGTGGDNRDVLVGTVFSGGTASSTTYSSGAGSHVVETNIRHNGDLLAFARYGAPLFKKSEICIFWFYFDRKFSSDTINVNGETWLLSNGNYPGTPPSAGTYWGPTIVAPYCNFFVPY